MILLFKVPDLIDVIWDSLQIGIESIISNFKNCIVTSGFWLILSDSSFRVSSVEFSFYILLTTRKKKSVPMLGTDIQVVKFTAALRVETYSLQISLIFHWAFVRLELNCCSLLRFKNITILKGKYQFLFRMMCMRLKKKKQTNSQPGPVFFSFFFNDWSKIWMLALGSKMNIYIYIELKFHR